MRQQKTGQAPFYIISIVVHDQSKDLSEQIHTLDETLKLTSLQRNFIHVGPLIRRKDEYLFMNSSERLQILRRLIKFAIKTDFLYETFYIEKKHIIGDKEMIMRLARQLSTFLKQHYPYFLSFDVIKPYYDHGQNGVLGIILSHMDDLTFAKLPSLSAPNCQLYLDYIELVV